MNIIINGTLSFLEKLMVLLRDGRTLIGYLRSVDQFANLVLHKTIERIHVGNDYGDIPRGIFIIRGENVVLLGEIVCIHYHIALAMVLDHQYFMRNVFSFLFHFKFLGS